MTTTFCTSQDVLDRIGLYANSTIAASTAIIERYIATSEGVVVGETGINYLTQYSNVNVSLKENLRTATASHAANNIIFYDTGGYSSSTEFVNLANKNLLEFNRSIARLKDLDANKIRSVNV
jgi:hypothetical protein